MRRALSVGLAVLMAVGVAAGIFVSVTGCGKDAGGDLTAVRGVIGSEKQPFFRDPAVVKAFAAHGLKVAVDTAGSRAARRRTAAARPRPPRDVARNVGRRVRHRARGGRLPPDAGRRLPAAAARLRGHDPIDGPRTALQVLLDQLVLLEDRLADVIADLSRGDTEKLLAHERFLQERFSRRRRS